MGPVAGPLPPAVSSHAPQRIGAIAAVALHALALSALMSYAPARSALLEVAPIMVDLITPPRIETEPEPPVEVPPPRPRPKPLVKPVVRQPEPPPLVTAPVEAPSPLEIAPPPPPPSPAPPIVAVAPPPVVVPVTPPIFTADYLENPPPAYPALSRRLGEQGRVVLRVRVNAGGGADEIQIRASSGHARLDDAARAAVRRWKFIPARRGEQPVAAWVLIPIAFRLEG